MSVAEAPHKIYESCSKRRAELQIWLREIGLAKMRVTLESDAIKIKIKSKWQLFAKQFFLAGAVVGSTTVLITIHCDSLNSLGLALQFS